MPRKKIAAGNWKMNTSLEEGLQITRTIANANKDTDVNIVLAVPFTHLKTIIDMSLNVPNLFVAAQNCSQHKNGAYTGEISAEMLASLHIPYCVIGHSERRIYHNESDEQIATKASLLLENNIEVIFCCGESLEIRKANNHIEFVSQQIKNGLFHLNGDQIKNITIAYEPIWAIGTGETATEIEAEEMHSAIRSLIQSNYGKDNADQMSIVYGGSVKPNNSKSLFNQQNIDGGLVGGASLKSNDFIEIINSF